MTVKLCMCKALGMFYKGITGFPSHRSHGQSAAVYFIVQFRASSPQTIFPCNKTKNETFLMNDKTNSCVAQQL